MRKGDKVKLKDGPKKGETAIVEFWCHITDECKLDRPLGGSTRWIADELEVVETVDDIQHSNYGGFW